MITTGSGSTNANAPSAGGTFPSSCQSRHHPPVDTATPNLAPPNDNPRLPHPTTPLRAFSRLRKPPAKFAFATGLKAASTRVEGLRVVLQADLKATHIPHLPRAEDSASLAKATVILLGAKIMSLAIDIHGPRPGGPPGRSSDRRDRFPPGLWRAICFPAANQPARRPVRQYRTPAAAEYQRRQMPPLHIESTNSQIPQMIPPRRTPATPSAHIQFLHPSFKFPKS